MVGTLSEMTWSQVAALDSARTVAVLPLGATEAHGPHLPLGTDDLIVEGMARDGAHRLSERGLDVIVLPTVRYTPAEFAAGFPGTVSIGAETATALLVDIGLSLARHGLRRIAVASAHFDPVHVGTIYAASERLSAQGVEVVFPDLTRRPWASRMTDEFKTGACHAGRYESSVVMAERPELVDEALRRDLVPNPASLSVAIRDGKSSFEEAGGPEAYFGWPADATAEEGREVIGMLGSILEDAVMEALSHGDGGE
jgi:creatinine amidohydrolase